MRWKKRVQVAWSEVRAQPYALEQSRIEERKLE